MEIVRAGAERIPDLQPLWEALSRHHAQVAPELEVLGEVRPAAESWAARRALYEDWLQEPDAFVLIAEADGMAIGYAVVQLRGPEETWATGDRVAVLETLAVLPEHRGKGIGSALVEQMNGELRRLGVGEFLVGVIASNADAIRFYERLGLTRFLITYAGTVPAMSTNEKPQIEIPQAQPPSYQLELEDLTVGEGDEAVAGQVVEVHYVGVSWSSGEEFDSSWDRGDTFKFGLGKGKVIRGWDEGVAGMRVGGRRRITIPPDLAYGKRGAGGVIGPDETLVFVVDLVGVR